MTAWDSYNARPMGRLRVWTGFFDDATLQRGRSLGRRGAVLERDFDPEDRVIAGIVEGSGENEYEVRISLGNWHQHPSLGLVVDDLIGECSCPVGFDCKHVVALLLDQFPFLRENTSDRPVTPVSWRLPEPPLPEFVQPNTSPERSKVLGWLQQLPNAETPLLLGGRHLCYVLHLDHHPPTISCVVGELDKRGRWKIRGQPQRTHELRLRVGKVKYIDDHDIRLIGLMGRISPWGDHCKLTGDLGCHLLDGACAAGRLLLAGDQQPLERVEERYAELSWLRHNDTWTVQVQDGEDRLLQHIPSTPPRFVDETRRVTGPLRIAGLRAEVLAALLRMPPVDSETLLDIWPRLHEIGAPQPPLELLEQEPATFEAKLTLWRYPITVNANSAKNAWQVTACLVFPWFRYHDHDLPIDFPRRSLAGPQGRILRNIAAEQDLIQALSQVGLRRFEELAPSVQCTLKDSALKRAWIHWPEGLSQRGRNPGNVDSLPVPLAARLRLETAGWQLEAPEHPDEALTPELAEVDDWDCRVEEDAQRSDWFRLHLGVYVGDERIDLLPILRELAACTDAELQRLPRDGSDLLLEHPSDGRLLRLPENRVLGMLRTLLDLFDEHRDSDDGLSVPQHLPGLDEGLEELDLPWKGLERLQGITQQLRDWQSREPPRVPAELQATLRPYQRQGLGWLQMLRDSHLGGVLADDMGLGKTIQTLAHLLIEQAEKRLVCPAIVVAPTSLLENWRREAVRFAPKLRCLVLYGGNRHQHHAKLDHYDLVITSYGVLIRDLDTLAEQHWHCLICDEAQYIKNHRAQSAAAVRRLSANQRLALTGTPLENHLGELWSQMDHLNPGLLGTEKRFNKAFRHPIEKHRDRERQDLLRRRVAPFLLRRTKEAVATELPAKTEIIERIDLDDEQRALYESVRIAMDDQVREAISTRGLASSRIIVLDALLKLRQVCCDPALVKKMKRAKGVSSAKRQALTSMLEEMLEEGRRILLFSQFASMLDLIASDCDAAGITYSRITGRTRKRQDQIDRFQNGEAPLFLISLKAGGTGLNLTAADTVIHYDPWWNPAVEAQATDRAHRIGQDKPVFVYKLIAAGTVEEQVLELQAQKRGLADALFDDSGQNLGQLDEGTIQSLLAPVE